MRLDLPLRSYAVTQFNTRGRERVIDLAKDRNEFQRDYTRILHSRAFRRLQGKTQVFPAQLGSIGASFRTRMSHSFEVEQISRSVCRLLGLNQDLSAVLAIGHDIGHAPFGHLGQEILNRCFSDIGGFEHNYQALRLVDHVESPYPGSEGLNLMFETREGLLKHCSAGRARKLGDVGLRHLDGRMPPLEVQVVDSSDQLAYLYGDLEDAVDHRLLSPELLMEEMPGFKECWAHIFKSLGVKFPTSTELDDPRLSEKSRALLSEVWRRMLSSAIEDLSMNSLASIEREGITSLEDVRSQSRPLIGLSEEFANLHRDIRRFSHARLYDHPVIMSGRQYQATALEAMINSVRANPVAWGVLDGSNALAACDLVSSQTDVSVLSWYADKTLSPNISLPRP